MVARVLALLLISIKQHPASDGPVLNCWLAPAFVGPQGLFFERPSAFANLSEIFSFLNFSTRAKLCTMYVLSNDDSTLRHQLFGYALLRIGFCEGCDHCLTMTGISIRL